jgi:hypothetical protein
MLTAGDAGTANYEQQGRSRLPFCVMRCKYPGLSPAVQESSMWNIAMDGWYERVSLPIMGDLLHTGR